MDKKIDEVIERELDRFSNGQRLAEECDRLRIAFLRVANVAYFVGATADLHRPTCSAINPRTGTQCGIPADQPHDVHSNGTICVPWEDIGGNK